MKHAFLDEFADLDSPVHRIAPMAKVLFTLLVIVFIVVTELNGWWEYGAYFAVILVMMLVSRVPFIKFLKRVAVVTPFILVISIFIIFFRGRNALVTFPFFGMKVTIYEEGLMLFVNIVIRAFLSIMALAMLSFTTRFSDILIALEKLKVPKVIVKILSFLYRYLFLISDEFMRMVRAFRSRDFGIPFWARWRTLTRIQGTMFIRSYERSERVYQAMCARGYDGNVRSFPKSKEVKPNFAFAVAVFAVIIAIKICGVLYG